ncbi:hypothetical protein Bca4012_030067 [Brassica carinata]|uniref:F-box domain-containing protein n=1 Tax=Brassica carinata TaxID=52824 RepID=A0A8X7RJA6_BRACI|nr:hypothetical protein Bca52824_048516 [Brassica carinata]
MGCSLNKLFLRNFWVRNRAVTDLVEEILIRVPITSLGAVRSTCKRWNTLSKSRLLCKAKANQQFVGFMRKNSKLCSLRFDLHEEEFAVKEIDNQVEISKVFVCNGLLLCVNVKSNDIQSLMAWNPYLGQTRWIHQQEQHLTTG